MGTTSGSPARGSLHLRRRVCVQCAVDGQRGRAACDSQVTLHSTLTHNSSCPLLLHTRSQGSPAWGTGSSLDATHHVVSTRFSGHASFFDAESHSIYKWWNTCASSPTRVRSLGLLCLVTADAAWWPPRPVSFPPFNSASAGKFPPRVLLDPGIFFFLQVDPAKSPPGRWPQLKPPGAGPPGFVRPQASVLRR